MNADDWKKIQGFLAGTDIDELTLSWPGGSLRIRRDGASGMSDDQFVIPVHGHRCTQAVRAPAAGIFLDRQPGDTKPMVQVGEAVVEGRLVAFIQVGPLLLPVKAPSSGKIGAFAVPPGSCIGYGDDLLQLQSTET